MENKNTTEFSKARSKIWIFELYTKTGFFISTLLPRLLHFKAIVTGQNLITENLAV